MNDSTQIPLPSPPPRKAPYVWAVVIIIAIAASMVVAILGLRPNSDPLEIITKIAGWTAPTIAAVLAFLKSQETHLSVNSRLDAFMLAQAKVSRAEGILKGVADEQARAALHAEGKLEGVTDEQARAANAPPVILMPVEPKK